MFNDVVRALVELTENKLVAAVVPVLLGAGLLAWWFKLRDRRLAIRDESLKVVNEVADLLNCALSPLFGAIRNRSVKYLDVVDEGIGDLFRHRLSTRARSLALLDTPQFSREYDEITWRLRECVDEIRESTKAVSADGDVSVQIVGVDWEKSLSTAKDIWNAAALLIEAGINRTLRGKRPTFPPHKSTSPEMMRLRNEYPER